MQAWNFLARLFFGYHFCSFFRDVTKGSKFQKNYWNGQKGFCLSVIFTACYLMTFFSLNMESTGNANKASSKMRKKPGSNLVTNDIGTGIISSLFTIYKSWFRIQISKKIFRKNRNFINLGWFLEVNVKISSLKVIWKIDWEIVFETRQNFQNNICSLNISL